MRLFFPLRVARWWGCGCLLAGLLALPLASPAQAPPPGTAYLAPLKIKNLSYLWQANQLVFNGVKSPDVFPEPLGFMGANYQRFYLHYSSVRPAPARPYAYQVSGKTRVKANGCAFTGPLTTYFCLDKQRKPCHWGGFKIPDSGDLDFSVSDFEVAAKDVANGWQTYVAALEGQGDFPKTRQARAEEKRPRWT